MNWIRPIVRSMDGSAVRVAVLLSALLVAGQAQAQRGSPDSVVKKLNDDVRKVSLDRQSAGPVLSAWLKATQPPATNANLIWPKMKDWSSVSSFAQQNKPLGDALIAAQNAVSFGLLYGVKNVDPTFAEKKLFVDFASGEDFGLVDFGYFPAIKAIGVYAVAEMYRAGEAKDFDRAFAVGIAWLRFLRQMGDRDMLDEKLFAINAMTEALSIHRDFLWYYKDAVPVATLKRVSLQEYALIRAGDSERMKRLQLPEGDLLLAQAVMERTFDKGQPDADQFVHVYANQDSVTTPIMRFGSAKLWRAVAERHGSKDASDARLIGITDDWFRRWRSKPYGKLSQTASELSRTNEVRYAAIIFSIDDLRTLFDARNLLIANVNGTAASAGLCAYRIEYQNTWPRDIKNAYAIHVVKRLDFDPYDKLARKLSYRSLDGVRTIESPAGQLKMDGMMLWALGVDNADNDGKTHSDDGSNGDLLLFPPVRALAREQGILE
ncbi:MAG: hypothetical protein O2800_01705 [Planctomycetota bacterium]|nr:hypothetical protein [Planctomycetota bacterium]